MQRQGRKRTVPAGLRCSASAPYSGPRRSNDNNAAALWWYAHQLVREQTPEVVETPRAVQNAGINSRGVVFSVGTLAVLAAWPDQPPSWYTNNP